MPSFAALKIPADFGLARITQSGESTLSQEMIIGPPEEALQHAPCLLATRIEENIVELRP